MRIPSRPRGSIAGTSLFALTFLGISAGFAYLNPEGLDRLLGGATDHPSCSAAGPVPCFDTMPTDACCLLPADEEPQLCFVPQVEAELVDAISPDAGADPALDCCQGGLSRGALLGSSTPATPLDDLDQADSQTLADEAISTAQDETPIERLDAHE